MQLQHIALCSNVHVRVRHAVYCMQCVVTRDAFIIAH